MLIAFEEILCSYEKDWVVFVLLVPSHFAGTRWAGNGRRKTRTGGEAESVSARRGNCQLACNY